MRKAAVRQRGCGRSFQSCIRVHLGESTAPLRIAPARAPPLWDLPDSGTGDFDPQAQPASEYVFDQRIAW